VTRRLDPEEMERRAKRLGLDRMPLEELEAILKRALKRTFSQVSDRTRRDRQPRRKALLVALGLVKPSPGAC